MSYEGYEEFLCQNGHYWTVDAMTMMHGEDKEKNESMLCSTCHHKAVYVVSVDETNGVDVDVPETMPAPKKLIGHTDIPLTDHYGNRYFGKVNRYEPVFDNPRQMFKHIGEEQESDPVVQERTMISVDLEALGNILKTFTSADDYVRAYQTAVKSGGVCEVNNPIKLLNEQYYNHFNTEKSETTTVPQVFKSMESLVVDSKALKQVLSALNGPAHHIRELQATRNLPGDDNPINTLINQYNAWVEDQLDS